MLCNEPLPTLTGLPCHPDTKKQCKGGEWCDQCGTDLVCTHCVNSFGLNANKQCVKVGGPVRPSAMTVLRRTSSRCPA